MKPASIWTVPAAPRRSATRVKSNHINGACAGILQGTGSTASFATNTIVNAANVTLTGSDVCPAATTSAFPRSRHASHRPAP